MPMLGLFRPVYQREREREGREEMGSVAETWHLRIMKELHLLDDDDEWQME